tara:strand:- start:181 stop:411 length:231 start_codon:yes stop_codon:yes gene_type:complete
MDKLRVVCSTCRTPIAQQEYNYKKQKWIWQTIDVCCNDSEQRLTKMADVQAIDKPEIKEGRNEGIEPSFYDWELNR